MQATGSGTGTRAKHGVEFRRGARVAHPDFGMGTVIRLARRNNVRVAFEESPGLPRTVSRSLLEVLEDAPQPAQKISDPVKSARPTPILDAGPIDLGSSLARAEAWQSLEAMRLGVVPSTGVAAYTVQRELEIAHLKRLLKTGGGFRSVWGDYGAGKTHLLDVLEHQALEEGFVTARVTVDPKEIALQFPSRVYAAIVDRLQVPDAPSDGLAALLDVLADSDAHNAPDGERASTFFTPYLFARKKNDASLATTMLDYARAEPFHVQRVRRRLRLAGWRGPKLIGLPDYRTLGRVYVHLLGTLSCWARDAGFRGLLIVLDEVERVDALSTDDYKKALEVLCHYAAVTMRPEDLNFDPETLYKGGHQRQRALPLRFEDDQPLALVMAMTPLQEAIEKYSRITESPDYSVHLRPLVGDVTTELALKIAGVYRTAYPSFEITADELTRVSGEVEHDLGFDTDGFRPRIRSTVAHLDALRLSRT